jgi:hypothetical protein
MCVKLAAGGEVYNKKLFSSSLMVGKLSQSVLSLAISG